MSEARFRRVRRDEQYLMPPSVWDWVPATHASRFVVEVLDELDLSEFFVEYQGRRDRGRPAYHPTVMVGIVLYASMRAVMSTRRIEQALVTDVGFRLVAANEQPDHVTIARFIKRHRDRLKVLFEQVRSLADEAGIVDPSPVAVDGTKMAGNASKRRNVAAGDLRERFEQWAAEVEANDAAEDDEERRGGGGPVPAMFNDESRREWIKQRLADKADEPVERRVNTTDPDSGLLPRHGGGWVQGYNAQAAAVAGGFVVAAEVTASPLDWTMLPKLFRLLRACCALSVIVADAGYWHTATVEEINADDESPDVLIPPGRQLPDGPPAALPEPDPAAYDEAVAKFEADLAAEMARRRAVIGLVIDGTITLAEAARRLGMSISQVGALAEQWRQAGGPHGMALPKRRRPKRPKPPSQAARARHEMETRLARPAGRSLYRQRQAIIEGVFGDIKNNRRITRFLRRGLDNVRAEWHWILTGHNLTILHKHRLATR